MILFSSRSGFARWIGRFATLAALALGWLLAAGIASAANFTVARTSFTTLYADTAHSDPHLCNYAAYRITADAPVTDVWATIGNFAGGRITLSSLEDGLYHVGAIPVVGNYRMAFFYLCGDTVPAIGELITGQTHTLYLWDRDPSLPGATMLSATNWTLNYAHAHINARANKIDSITIDPPDPDLGERFVIRVDGRTGTVGSDEHLIYTPAAHADWPAGKFELVSTFINLPNVGLDPHDIADELAHTGLAVTSSDTPYYALYTFRVTGTVAAQVETSPYGFIDSGQNLKHTDVSHNVYPPVCPCPNPATLAKSANPTLVVRSASTTDITFVVRIANSDDHEITLDQIRDVLPAGFTYAAGTATYNGAPIGDPFAAGQNLAWSGSFPVPALGSRELVFHGTLQANPSVGTYDNCATARINGTQIDSTAEPNDNVPACARVTVIDQPVGGAIVVSKTTVGGGASFSYTGSGGAPVGNFTIDASAGSGAQAFSSVPAGAYTIAETVPAGWTLTNINCVITLPSPANEPTTFSYTGAPGGTSAFEPGDTAATITLGSGAQVRCAFTNTKSGSITIVKSSTPAAGATFGFSASPPLTPASFSLQPPGSPQQAYTNVSAGTYSVTENAPAGWTLASIECAITTAGSNTTSFAFTGAASGTNVFELGDTTAQISLGAGDAVTCTYGNVQNGTITIVKQTQDGDGTFTFNTSGPPVQLTTVGGSAQATPFASAAPGTYSIAEVVPVGWTLYGISCTSTNGESVFLYTGAPIGPQDVYDPGDTTATIYLGAADAVTCTFLNRQGRDDLVPIPTLSEWMLVLLTMLVLAGGALALHRRGIERR